MPSSISSPASSRATALAVCALTGPTGDPSIFEVDVVLPIGETHLVLGPIHSGKSMLMRHLVGLECAERGRIVIADESFDASDPEEAVRRRMQTRVGVIFEGSALITRISAIENVELPLLEHTTASRGEARDAARELLAEVGLRVEGDETPGQLGRAERRRVALARALALRPPVLLLDEPTHGLDAGAAADLDETIAQLQARHGFGVLIFSREVRHAFGRATHIYVMFNGRILEHGERAALQRSPTDVVRQLFHRRGRE
jgi:ABC-type transporter Mla maintaining outer membrane lipid asymmetry ATPase subunit MlaF